MSGLVGKSHLDMDDCRLSLIAMLNELSIHEYWPGRLCNWKTLYAVTTDIGSESQDDFDALVCSRSQLGIL